MLHVSSIINSDIETVWNCFTQPEHITKWNFASDDWHCPAAINEVRVGGRMSWTMAAKDGSFSFDLEAVYKNVDEYELLETEMPDGRNVITKFEEAEGGVMVSEDFDPESENPHEMQVGGWQAILNNFKKYCESL
jgi:uncharacterized protein YndB with AHSA1/START domain